MTALGFLSDPTAQGPVIWEQTGIEIVVEVDECLDATLMRDQALCGMGKFVILVSALLTLTALDHDAVT